MKTIIIVFVLALFLNGCLSTNPNAIMPAQEINKYLEHNCSTLAEKANEITLQSTELKQTLQNRADLDGGMFAVSMLIAWPALFAIQGEDKDTSTLYGKIKGELLNIQEADIVNKCNIEFSKETLSIVSIK